MRVATFEIETGPVIEHECPQCSSTRLHQDPVRTAIWQGERLIVVEGIPALVCDACGERFYDDATVTQLDLLQGEGFPVDGGGRFITVPVFAFGQRASQDGSETEKTA